MPAATGGSDAPQRKARGAPAGTVPPPPARAPVPGPPPPQAAPPAQPVATGWGHAAPPPGGTSFPTYGASATGAGQAAASGVPRWATPAIVVAVILPNLLGATIAMVAGIIFMIHEDPARKAAGKNWLIIGVIGFVVWLLIISAASFPYY
jgi:hypothetical protein